MWAPPSGVIQEGKRNCEQGRRSEGKKRPDEVVFREGAVVQLPESCQRLGGENEPERDEIPRDDEDEDNRPFKISDYPAADDLRSCGRRDE